MRLRTKGLSLQFLYCIRVDVQFHFFYPPSQAANYSKKLPKVTKETKEVHFFPYVYCSMTCQKLEEKVLLLFLISFFPYVCYPTRFAKRDF